MNGFFQGKIKFIATLLSPLLLGAALWVEPLWFLILIAFVPFLFVVDSLDKKEAKWFLVYFIVVSALTFALPLLSFQSINSFALSTSQFAVLAVTVLLYVGVIAGAAYLMLWLVFVRFKEHTALKFAFPIFWVGFEFIRARLSFGLLWASVGEPLIEFLPLAIFARIGGVYLLSFVVLAFNIAAHQFLAKSREFVITGIAKPLMLYFGPFILLIAVGFFYLALEEKLPAAKTLRIASVQVRSLSAEQSTNQEYFPKLYAATHNALKPRRGENYDLLVLPGNYSYAVSKERISWENLTAIRETVGEPPAVIFGYSYFAGDGRVYQAQALYSKEEPEPQLTFKKALFPVIEYLPTAFAKISGLKLIAGNYTAGEQQVFTLPYGKTKTGIIFCSEQFVPELVKNIKRQGADFIIVTGNTDDFSSGLAHREVLRTARIRAMENNTYLLLAMKTGISAYIDPHGKVIKRLDRGEETVIFSSVPVKE